MYFDEDLILDLRLNYLNNFVDKFVIIESKYNHNGDIRKPLFDIKKFEKFEKKIIYHLIDHEPKNLKRIFDNETIEKQTNKKISNNNNLTTIYSLNQNYKKRKNKQTKTTAYTNQTKWKIK